MPILLIAQLVINNSRLEIIELSPFFANTGRYVNIFMEPRNGINVYKAIVKASNIEKLYSKIRN